MKRGIDHIVLAARHLESACAYYERMGFTLTPPAQHPFGTGNRLAQLRSGFLEILSVTRPKDVMEHKRGVFRFAAYNRDFLQQRQGLSMVALSSDSWEDDREAFIAAGLELPEPFAFSRLARQPDGHNVTVGFDLTFAPDPELPNAVFFTCQHRHDAEFFYKSEYQSHINGAHEISEVIMVAKDAGCIRRLCSSLLEEEYVFDDEAGLYCQVDGARIRVLTEQQLVQRFPGHDVISFAGDGVFAGFGLRVSDLDVTRSVLKSAEIDFADKGGSIWLSAFGTIVEFAPLSTGGKPL